MKTIADLMLLVAENLAGRPCVIEFGNRPPEGTRGTLTRDLRGRPVITISNNLDREQYLKTFLHEIGHVKLHLHRLAKINRIPPKQNHTGPALKASDLREQEARALADKWLTYADRRADDLEGRLFALLNYQTT